MKSYFLNAMKHKCVLDVTVFSLKKNQLAKGKKKIWKESKTININSILFSALIRLGVFFSFKILRIENFLLKVNSNIYICIVPDIVINLIKIHMATLKDILLGSRVLTRHLQILSVQSEFILDFFFLCFREWKPKQREHF